MKINPRQLQRVMKQMGMLAEEIEAEEVVIKGKGRNIVISNPQVTRVNVMGKETFQVAGDVMEKAAEKFTEEDVKMVMDQTGTTEQEARKALEEAGDLAEAILRLKKNK